MKEFIRSCHYPTHRKRFCFFFLMDILLICASLFLSFLLRFDFHLNERYLFMILRVLPLFLFVKLIVFSIFRLYRITWRYAGIYDISNVAKAVSVSQISLILIILLFFDVKPFNLFPLSFFRGFPRSVFIIDGLVSFFLLSGLRISKRICLEVIGKGSRKKGLNTVIVGAGNIGETLVRDMIRQKFADYYPVAFLDDDREKIGSFIHGVQVFGEIGILKEIVKRLKAEVVIIAIPSLNYKKLRIIYNMVKQSGAKTIKVVPSMYVQHKPQVNIREFRDISIEDLIGRQNVTVDYEQIGSFIRGKTVLVTGAGGSIGSEIAMQVCSFNPEKIILLDADETELHNMEMKIKREYESLFGEKKPQADGGLPDISGKVYFVVGDVRDRKRMEAIFKKFRPCIVFHSAAYKHVPMMECNPGEAVKVNIFGTFNLADISYECGVEKFIMISTDKAVKPASIMGSTKKMAEYICMAFNCMAEEGAGGGGGKTAFISVRFGNVLGSRGSILPLFLDQLKQGGPVTVTHRDMKRYFMTIPEAVALVLQASVIGKGGEVMVLDMGEPVAILSLAEELISLHGLKPYDDIKIEFTGIRSGENLFEEILTAEEVATRHEKIFVAGSKGRYTVAGIEKILEEFRSAIDGSYPDYSAIRDLLNRYAGYSEVKKDEV